MSLLRFILWSLIFYLVLRTIKNVMNFLSPNKNNPPKKNVNTTPSKYKIDKEDVIEAHFEELDSTKSENPKEKS